jgi:hypothetical protein
MTALFITVGIAIAVGMIIDLMQRIPVGQALILRHGFIVLCHGAPNLWWLLTIYRNYWGIEIFYYPEPYWSSMEGYTRKVGVWLGGISIHISLGRTGKRVDDCVVRQVPSQKWYEFQM